MELTLHINDDKINEILTDNINGVSKEQIAEALLEGIKQYMSNEDGKKTIEKILFGDSYYYSNLTDTGKRVVAEAIKGDNLDRLESMANDIIEKHFNELLVQAIAQILLENISRKIDLSAALWNSQGAMDTIKIVVNRELDNRNSGGY